MQTFPRPHHSTTFLRVRITNANQSSHFYELFGCKEVSHRHITKINRHNNLNIPMLCSSKHRCSFYVNGIKFCNKLPNVLKSSPSIFSFKKNLRRHQGNRLLSDLTIVAFMWVLNANKTAVSIYTCINISLYVFMDGR